MVGSFARASASQTVTINFEDMRTNALICRKFNSFQGKAHAQTSEYWGMLRSPTRSHLQVTSRRLQNAKSDKFHENVLKRGQVSAESDKSVSNWTTILTEKSNTVQRIVLLRTD